MPDQSQESPTAPRIDRWCIYRQKPGAVAGARVGGELPPDATEAELRAEAADGGPGAYVAFPLSPEGRRCGSAISFEIEAEPEPEPGPAPNRGLPVQHARRHEPERYGEVLQHFGALAASASSAPATALERVLDLLRSQQAAESDRMRVAIEAVERMSRTAVEAAERAGVAEGRLAALESGGDVPIREILEGLSAFGGARKTSTTPPATAAGLPPGWTNG